MTESILGFSGKHDFLSNFYRFHMRYRGRLWAASENAYQAEKFIDPEFRAQFLDLTPGQAKRLSRTRPCRPDWDEIRLDVMLDVLRAKFQSPYLRGLLLKTGDVHLEEVNTWSDRYWGTVDGVGENWLGKLLIQVRAEIRSEDESA